MAKEINLVPDIKNEFIKTLKFRNFVFFLCIVVASSSLVVILIFLSIAGGQQGFITAKQATIDALEKKISDYSDLSDFLTIRDQLGNISAITENKVMMSRTFNILSAIIPRGADYVNISELSVNLSQDNDAATFTFDAQANAGTEPYIDYKVLDSFKKSMQYMRYDYGEYVDKNDQAIPAYCILETAEDGSMLKDPAKGYFAYWLITGDGCNPSADEVEEEEEDDEWDVEAEDNIEAEKPAPTAEEIANQTGYQIEQYNGQNVVRIWRTPQYSDWYKKDPNDDEPYMDLNGEIHNIPHFNSACIKYSGTEKDDNNIVWASTNDTCLLVPEGTNGIVVEASSNGRDADDQLVLRFSATISFAQEVFNFNNHHMLALPPSGHRNVTDSYAQIQSIFAERATDCEQDDTACITTPTGDTNSDNNNNNNNTEDKSEEEEEELW